MASEVDPNVRCNSCGGLVQEPVGLSHDQRKPCPSCGSLARRFAVTIAESVSFSTHMSMIHEREGEAIGFGESEREGRASGSNLEGDGSLTVSISGSSPQGEEDTPSACRVLLERLKQDGRTFVDVEKGGEPADCVLTDGERTGARLEVQVVRAIASQDIWRRLSREGAAQATLSPAKAVRDIRRAISLKADDRKIPMAHRANLVLALDATRLPGLGFDAIVREFRASESVWAASLGFRAVWLVGPSPRLTWRLDIAPDP